MMNALYFFICIGYGIEMQFTLVNKQIAYLLGISLETDQIMLGKKLLLICLLKASVQKVFIAAVFVQHDVSRMDCIFFSCSRNVPAC
jgi:hypothetical protein